MSDPFTSYSAGITDPATMAFAVSPSDTIDLAQITRALNVAQSGLVQVQTSGGSTATVFIAAGIAFPIRAARVLATGTTASGIVGLL